MVHKSYHPWSWFSTSSHVLNHGLSKSPYDSCTHSIAELQPVEPISSFRQKKKTKKKTSESCMSSRMDCEKNGVWLYDQVMVELRNEGPRAFHHVKRMPPAMID